MTQLTTHHIDVFNVKTAEEEALLIAEAEESIARGEKGYTLEEFFIHSEKMLANLGK